MEKELESKDKEINNLKNEFESFKSQLLNKNPKYIGKKDNLAKLERVIIEHKLEKDRVICDKCGNPLVVIGKKSSKKILKYTPVKLYIEEQIT